MTNDTKPSVQFNSSDIKLSFAEEVKQEQGRILGEPYIRLQSTKHGRSAKEVARIVSEDVTESIDVLDAKIVEMGELTRIEVDAVHDYLNELSEVMDLVGRRLDLDLNADDAGVSVARKSEESAKDYSLYCDYESVVRNLLEKNEVLIEAPKPKTEAFVLA